MRLHIERKFSAAHCLKSKKLTPVENELTYGQCSNVHGHTWKVCVDLEGPVSEANGMVVNFVAVKKIIDKLDHSSLNSELELPTAENLVSYFLDKLIALKLLNYIKVRVYESDNAYAEDEWNSE